MLVVLCACSLTPSRGSPAVQAAGSLTPRLLREMLLFLGNTQVQAVSYMEEADWAGDCHAGPTGGEGARQEP